jgi:hypothetical protein
MPRDEPPIACTLEPGDMGDRLAAWRALIDTSAAVEPTVTGVHISFDAGVDAADIARLVQAEQRCCVFLRFTIGIARSAVTLDIVGPRDARRVIDAIVGSAS